MSKVQKLTVKKRRLSWRLRKNANNRRAGYVISVFVMALIGTYFLSVSHAASYAVRAEAESGTIAGGASIIADPNASGGYAVILDNAIKATAVKTDKGSSSSATTATKTSSVCGSLTAMPENSEPTGTEGVDWAECALDNLGAPLTIANIQTLTTWFLNEGTPHDPNNPLNLQTPYGGSTVSTADGDPASVGIEAYPTPADFGAAFALEMQNPSYPTMLSDLKSGAGMLNSTNSALESQLQVYSGNGYDSIPAAYLNGQLGAK